MQTTRKKSSRSLASPAATNSSPAVLSTRPQTTILGADGPTDISAADSLRVSTTYANPYSPTSNGYHSTVVTSSKSENGEASEVDYDVKHGFEPEEPDESRQAYFFWTEARPEDKAYLPPQHGSGDWRSKDTSKARTTAAALVLCLRLGVEPPDVVKTNPCATLECWVETAVIDRDKALAEIAGNLEKQYLTLANSKVKYRTYPDALVDEAKKAALLLRRTAKSDRALFHYNGHGVPKPTPSGEIWVFNKEYTQYIPVSLYDLLGWVGTPSIFIWDCSAAANCVHRIEEAGKKRDADAMSKYNAQVEQIRRQQQQSQSGHLTEKEKPETPQQVQIPPPPVLYSKEVIQLAACLPHQSLPLNPSLPADLFTSCLTSPIETALRFFILRNPLKADLDISLAFKIPGKLSDRKSPLGELLWIFTAVTDTIAWNTLPPAVFQRLFRHDLVVAALFRGFLLAERIMRLYDCTPVSVPALPPMHHHPMWDSWDLAVDRCLNQLPAILQNAEDRKRADKMGETLPPEILFNPSRFFADQLQAFEIWLEQGTSRTTASADPSTATDPKPLPTDGMTRPHKVHPDQLPVVLQVLLSQAHRLRALIMLCKFLDLGPWAVHLALSIGIFPYVLKLLQAPAAELKPVLIYIWGRILGVYRSCQEDLLKSVVAAQGLAANNRAPDLPYQYFVKVLIPSRQRGVPPIPNLSEHRAMCSFILSMLCRDHTPGKMACMQASSPVMESCIHHLQDNDPLLRQWSALCLAQLWDDCDVAKVKACNLGAHKLLSDMVIDDSPEVRAAVLYALGTLMGTSGSSDLTKASGVTLSASLVKLLGATDMTANEVILGIAMSLLKVMGDGSPMVRRELVVVLSMVLVELPMHFVIAAYNYIRSDSKGGDFQADELAKKQAAFEQRLLDDSEGSPTNMISIMEFQDIIFMSIYKTVLDLSVDPYPRVAQTACLVLDRIHGMLLASPFATADPALSHLLGGRPQIQPQPNGLRTESLSRLSRQQSNLNVDHSESHPPRRSGSVAVALHKLTHFGFNDNAGPSPYEAPIRGSRTEHPSPDDNASPRIRTSGSVESLPDRFNHRYNDSTVSEAAKQLLAIDEERSKRRRSVPGTPQSERSSAPDFDTGEYEEMTEDLEYELPLRSDFYDYASRFFREPQLKQATEAEEPGSINYNTRLWRRERADSLVKQTQSIREESVKRRWEEQTAFYSVDSRVNCLLFHQFDDHLVCADSSNRISVFDWGLNKRLSRFNNAKDHGVGTQVTSLKFINELDKALLLVGSNDGCVKIWRDYDSDKRTLLTAFRALSDHKPSNKDRDFGLVTEWQQLRGQLVVGGYTDELRIWDAAKDCLTSSIRTRGDSGVTSITSDQISHDIIAAGFGDGEVRIYDQRSRDSEMVLTYRPIPAGWIQNVRMQAGGQRELMSGSDSGIVCFWDLRYPNPIATNHAHQGRLLTCDLHDHAPVYATGSEYQIVKIWSTKHEDPISRFRNSSGYLPQRSTADLTTLTFHPHYFSVAIGADDGHISVSCFPEAISKNPVRS